jgi:hypothetical protein
MFPPFSIYASQLIHVCSLREFESRGTPGKKTGVLAVIEGTRFWVREDALNKEKNLIDPAVSPLTYLPNLYILTLTRFSGLYPVSAV